MISTSYHRGFTLVPVKSMALIDRNLQSKRLEFAIVAKV